VVAEVQLRVLQAEPAGPLDDRPQRCLDRVGDTPKCGYRVTFAEELDRLLLQWRPFDDPPEGAIVSRIRALIKCILDPLTAGSDPGYVPALSGDRAGRWSGRSSVATDTTSAAGAQAVADIDALTPTAPAGLQRTLKRVRASRVTYTLLPILSLAVFFTVWQVVGGRVNPILLATPSSTAKAFWDLLTSGQLLPAFATTMKDLAIGYGLAIVAGVSVGVAMGRSPVLERIMDPYVNFFQATPLIALVPLIVIWFGVGMEARVAVVFLLAVWSVIINTTTGVKQTPAALLDVGRIYKFSRRHVITRIQLPNAVPSIFAGLRIALGKALIGIVIAQMEISVTGLGGIVVNYGNAFRTAYLLAGVVTASLVGVVAAVALEVIRKVAFPWTEEQEGGGWKAAI